MRDCLILGSGRSGTSMMGGILHSAGYFMGDWLYPGRDSNPKGFFENPDVNDINERILAAYRDETGLADTHTIRAPGTGQYWLMALDAQVEVECRDAGITAEIQQLAGRRPFAYKDPRFCYTLPAWECLVPTDTCFIVVFRDPAVTAASILKECASVPYLANLDMDASLALTSWTALYRQTLKHARRDPGRFTFVHYAQLLDGSGLEILSRRLGVTLQQDFVDPCLNRSRRSFDAGAEATHIYAELCELAAFDAEGARRD